MTYSCSVSEQRFRGFSPATTPIHRTTVKSQRHRITDLRTRRRELQQRAATYRASTGTPYPIEVHLLLGQTYLDPASWDALLHSRGPAVALRRARFAPRYDRLLRRLEEAITRYERP